MEIERILGERKKMRQQWAHHEELVHDADRRVEIHLSDGAFRFYVDGISFRGHNGCFHRMTIAQWKEMVEKGNKLYSEVEDAT